MESIKTERKTIKGLARFTTTHCLFQIISLITRLAVCYQSLKKKKKTFQEQMFYFIDRLLSAPVEGSLMSAVIAADTIVS